MHKKYFMLGIILGGAIAFAIGSLVLLLMRV